MLQLSSDESFHYELLRNLSHARYYGADVGDVLEVAGKIKAGDFESFYQQFANLAHRVHSQADQINANQHPVSARDAYFRASTYYRAADFYLHGHPLDARINELWEKQTTTFNKAISLLDIPGERLLLTTEEGFSVPAIYFRASGATPQTPRPTLLLGNGYDGAQEEMMHVCGFAALERGYNVITYEGPGQPSVVREQKLGFMEQWEKVVRPVMDYLESRSEVDAKRIGLVGYSMGGWLAVRAAAFEHRLAAVMAIDGVYDVFEAYYAMLPTPWKTLFDSIDSTQHQALDDAVREALKTRQLPPKVQWGIEQGLWSFNTASAVEWLQKVRRMTMQGLDQNIRCPVWIGDAAEDQFFLGQPDRLKTVLGSKGTLIKFTSEDGASNHCHVGSCVLMNQVVFDWFSQVIMDI